MQKELKGAKRKTHCTKHQHAEGTHGGRSDRRIFELYAHGLRTQVR